MYCTLIERIDNIFKDNHLNKNLFTSEKGLGKNSQLFMSTAIRTAKTSDEYKEKAPRLAFSQLYY